MSSNTPIYKIAKELNIESNRVILACKTLGINAKGATKMLNKEELENVKLFFEKGKNVAQEIVDIDQNQNLGKRKYSKIKKEKIIKYFPNRLIAKS
tara:strand:- start:15 stop:302 length:288 start_codon:yes stop_codon:yes gene_type:complete